MAVIPKPKQEFNVSTWVTWDVKKRLYDIAEQENITISTLVRKLIEKGLDEYER